MLWISDWSSHSSGLHIYISWLISTRILPTVKTFLPLKMNALVVREISKANGTFGFELEHDEKGPKKREGAHQVDMYYTLLK